MNLVNPSIKYGILAKNIPKVALAVGGVIQETPIICGGIDNQSKILPDIVAIGKPKTEMKLIEKRNHTKMRILTDPALKNCIIHIQAT